MVLTRHLKCGGLDPRLTRYEARLHFQLLWRAVPFFGKLVPPVIFRTRASCTSMGLSRVPATCIYVRTLPEDRWCCPSPRARFAVSISVSTTMTNGTRYFFSMVDITLTEQHLKWARAKDSRPVVVSWTNNLLDRSRAPAFSEPLSG